MLESNLLLMLSALISPLLVVRWLRWLGFVQQKEYRWDRFLVFIKTNEGKAEIFRFLRPKLSDFSRTGLKRPVPTSRAAVVATMSLFLLFLVFFFSWLVGGSLLFFVSVVVCYMILPFIVITATLPTAIIAHVLTRQKLRQAQQLLAQHKPYIIGVTGSYGKSTTKHLIAAVMKEKTSVFVTPKSHNTKYSVALAVLNHYQGEKVCVIEYAAYTKGEIKELASWIKPDSAVITGLAPQHLELFGSVEAIVKAKSELIKALPNLDALVLCNGADPGAFQICQAGGAHNITFFDGEFSQEKLKHVGLTTDGYLTFVWRGHTVITPLVGTHYKTAVLAAITAGVIFDVSEKEIITALSNFQPDETFISSYRLDSGSLVIDDGRTANPIGFKAGLDLIAPYHHKNQTTVLVTAGIVDLGDATSQIHTELASYSQDKIDAVWYLGQPGLAEFKHTFGSKLISDRSVIAKQLHQLGPDVVLLLEGKIPSWLMAEIHKLRLEQKQLRPS